MSLVEGPDADGVAIRLEAALPGARVSARPRGGSLRRRFRAAAAGVDSVAVVDVRYESAGIDITVRVPDVAGLDVGRVAQVVRTTAEVRQAFGRAASHLNELAFDQAGPEFRTNRFAGVAQTNLGHTHINANLVMGGAPGSRHSIEAVAAHEAWHQIEHAFELQRFRDSMELRRRLGEHFGVETLEQVLNANRPNARPEQRTALARLRVEVSDYATTNVREATAEMMCLWWCRRTPSPPIDVLFGRLMAQFFGVHRS